MPEAVKSERLAELQALLERQRQDFNHATVGKVVPVLLEKPGRHPGQVAGKSPYLQAVQIEGDVAAIGTEIPVRITRAGSNSLFGEALTATPAATTAKRPRRPPREERERQDGDGRGRARSERA